MIFSLFKKKGLGKGLNKDLGIVTTENNTENSGSSSGLSGINFSIRSKFLLMLLSISIFSMCIVGYQGFYLGHSLIDKGTKQQLTVLRVNRARSIEGYFKEKRSEVRLLADTPMMADALKEFISAYTLLESYQAELNEEQLAKLKNYYATDFIPKLRGNRTTPPLLDNFLPSSNIVKYLQYHYIAANTAEIEEKDLFDRADDKSYYTEVHGSYHPKIRDLVKSFGYEDLYLIDKETRNIVYSNQKGADFATSLVNDPYSQTNLSHLVDRVIQEPQKGKVLTIDFRAYAASYDAPAAFFATPVFDKNKFVGVLAAMISSRKINDIMSGNKGWIDDGLGESGEVYLVASDYLMRSDSRFLINSQENYFEQLASNGTSKSVIHLIKNYNTTIKIQPVETEASKAAIAGKSDVKEVVGYRGVNVLSAYAPLDITGLKWAIIAEKDEAEVTEPVLEFQRSLLVSAAIQSGIIIMFALWMARLFIRPIKMLVKWTKNIDTDEVKNKINLNRQDEFGELSRAFNTIQAEFNSKEERIAEETNEKNKLLLNLFPPSIAKRYQKGEKTIADSYSNVAILIASLYGFEKATAGFSPEEVLSHLNFIINSFDDSAEQFDVEKITTIGDTYMAACGLSNPRLDYVSRCVAFAESLFEAIDEYNLKYNTELKLRIGLSAGKVHAGVVGQRNFVYDLWGDTVTIANKIRHKAPLDGMRISGAVYKQLVNKESFTRCDTIKIQGIGSVESWGYQHEVVLETTLENNLHVDTGDTNNKIEPNKQLEQGEMKEATL